MTTDLSVTSTLSLFDTNKEQRMSFAALLVEQMERGNVDPLRIHYQVKCMQSIVELLTDGKSNLSKQYKVLVLDAAAKGRIVAGADVEIKEYGVKYDFSACGDQELLQQMEVYEAMGKAIKARQEFLKKIPLGDAVRMVKDDGEVVELYAPTKTSTTGVQMTLK